MSARVLALSLFAVVFTGCTKEAPTPDAGSTLVAQQGAPLSDCDQFGVAMRSLAFQRAARKVASRPWMKEPSAQKCRADWAKRLDTVAANFWMKVDCKAEETKELLNLFRATPDSARTDLSRFPDAPPDGGFEDPSLAKFHSATDPSIDATADEVIRRAEAIGNGDCPY